MEVLVYIELPRRPIPLFLFLCPPPLSPCLVFDARAFPSVLTVAELLRVRSDDCEEGPCATKTTDARGLATFSLMWESQIIPYVMEYARPGPKTKTVSKLPDPLIFHVLLTGCDGACLTL